MVAAITSLVQSEVVEVEPILLVKLFQLEAKNQVSLSEEILNVFFFDKKERRCNGEVFAQEGRFTRRPLLLLHSIDNSWCRSKITQIFIPWDHFMIAWDYWVSPGRSSYSL